MCVHKHATDQMPPAVALVQLGLLPEEDASHQQHELWLADAYNRSGRYQEAARQYRQLLAQGGVGEAWEQQQQQAAEERIELLCRLADIQVGGGGAGAPAAIQKWLPGGRPAAAVAGSLLLALTLLALWFLPSAAAEAG